MMRIIKIIFVVTVLVLATACNSNLTEADLENLQPTETYPIMINPTENPIAIETATPTLAPTATPTATPEPYTDIIIGATGDIMCHIQQVEDAYDATNGKGYSFYHWFKYIKPALEYPDLMIANLEGPIAGEDAEYNGYPMFNFPDEIVPAIKDAGIDVLVNGNNHIMDKKIAGIERTIQILDEAEIYHTGAWISAESRAVPLVIDVKGIKIGIISATYSLNGFAQHIAPEVLEYLVCYIDEEQVGVQIELCKEYGAEVIIVAPHMGDEFDHHTRRGLRNMVDEYVRLGADIVFGSHPHVLGDIVNIEVELDDGTTRYGLAYYSLGNFISSMYSISKEAGVIAYVSIRRDNATGEISIIKSEYLPTWVMRYGRVGDEFHILPVGQCIDYPETLDELSPNRGEFYRLDSVWASTIEVMGDDVATPLRYIPEN